MQLSTLLVFVSVLTRVLAQLNLGVILLELPACSVSSLFGSLAYQIT